MMVYNDFWPFFILQYIFLLSISFSFKGMYPELLGFRSVYLNEGREEYFWKQ